MDNIIRTVRLRPYMPGMGPTFTLTMSDSGRRDHRGCTVISYVLRQHEARRVARERSRTSVIFDGSDFCPSPMHADDSNASVAALLGFLTLRPGDTDREYFTNYSPEQMAFAESHGETLSSYAVDRFGE